MPQIEVLLEQLGTAGFFFTTLDIKKGNYSGLTAPLSDLTKSIFPDAVNWMVTSQQVFDTLKGLLMLRLMLTPPDYSKPFVVQKMH